MCRPTCRWFLLMSLIGGLASLSAQEKSVKPGINDAFRDPDPQEFQGKFEVESREVFARRADIVATCRIRPGMQVADVGAGTGLFTRLLAGAVGTEGRVIAVDISRKFLDHIERTSREAGLRQIETRLCEPDSVNLAPNSVDLVFICDTYHHFEFPMRTMASIHQALKPGGRLVVVDFRRIPGTSTQWVLNHVRAGQDVVEREITQSGFRKSAESAELLKENYLVEFTRSAAPGLKPWEFPLIAGYGGVVPLPNAAEQPRQGARVLFDITADAAPGETNRGLERAARLLNLYSAAGLDKTAVKIAIVLHGDATRGALSDAAHQSHYEGEHNPDLPLIRELQQAGVDVFVCGQALNARKFPADEVAEGITVAAAALTVVINRQADGYLVLPVSK